MKLLATRADGARLFAVEEEGTHGLGAIVAPGTEPLLLNVQSLTLHGGPWNPTDDAGPEIEAAASRAEKALAHHRARIGAEAGPLTIHQQAEGPGSQQRRGSGEDWPPTYSPTSSREGEE